MHVAVLSLVDSDDGTPDEVVPQVIAALAAQGHRAELVNVGGSVPKLANALLDLKPDLVYNLAEGFEGDDWADAPVAALLDLLAIPYTGSGPRALYVTQDKVLTKKILAFEGIATPKFAVFSRTDGFETGGNLRLPLFVKPLHADASLGIDAKKSLVSDMKSLLERVSWIHDEIGDAALAEEYVDGRELYVGIIGNDEAFALPVIEMDFSGLPPGARHVADFDAKWEEGTAQFQGTKSVLADLPDELRASVHEAAMRAYRALGLHDYARIDMRVAESGVVHVLEANANPYLEKASDLARAAQAHGMGYEDLVCQIAWMARERRRRLRGGHGT